MWTKKLWRKSSTALIVSAGKVTFEVLGKITPISKVHLAPGPASHSDTDAGGKLHDCVCYWRWRRFTAWNLCYRDCRRSRAERRYSARNSPTCLCEDEVHCGWERSEDCLVYSNRAIGKMWREIGRTEMPRWVCREALYTFVTPGHLLSPDLFLNSRHIVEYCIFFLCRAPPLPKGTTLLLCGMLLRHLDGALFIDCVVHLNSLVSLLTVLSFLLFKMLLIQFTNLFIF